MPLQIHRAAGTRAFNGEQIMSFKSLQLVMVPFCVPSPATRFDLRRTGAFIARHQIIFMLPCALAIGFMIACSA